MPYDQTTSDIPFDLFFGNWRRVLDQDETVILPRNSTSVALEASRVVKSGAGCLLGFSGYSNKGAAQFIQVFDSQTIPADGAVPKIVIDVTVSPWNFSYDGSTWGRWFTQGIVICNSSTAATKTIGSADCWFDAQYI